MTLNKMPDVPKHIWRHFLEISQIPRPSGREAAIRGYIISLARQHHFAHFVDGVGNLIVYVPATLGYERVSAVAIQNHLDMVTVKTADKTHDFNNDPLSLIVEGGWMTADRTSLGADNGIGVAAALAVMTDSSVVHPALELVFTVEEETGLQGAMGLDSSRISATRMINLDTEEWGEIYIGCAGGYGYEATRTLKREQPSSGLVPWRLQLKGLSGGHSGIQIHKQVGNANKLLVELLQDARELNWELVSFRGGVAHNVIAREASVIIMLDESELDRWNSLLENSKSRWLSYLPQADADLEWVFKPHREGVSAVLSQRSTHQFLALASMLPHGVQSYNLNQPADLADLSCNLALLIIEDDQLTVQTSLRFFHSPQAIGLKRQFETIFDLMGLSYKTILDYPGWKPNFESRLVSRTQVIAQKITGSPVALKAIHAGLECGIILSKKPEMDMVSFGPTIRGAHSPAERLLIDSVTPFWELITALLAELAVDE